MEGRVEAVDDQGSGWCEVRKKHRSSSKHSLPSSGGIGGLSGKNTSASRQPSLSKKHRIIQGNDRPWCPDNEVKVSMHGHNGITDATTTSVKNGIGSCFPQNSGVQQRSEENACPSSSQLAIATSIVGDTATSTCNPPSPMSLPKIKWGYLDDEDLLQHCESNSQLDIRSDEAQDRSSKDKFHEDHNVVLQEFASTNLQEKKPAATSLDVQTCPNDKTLYNVEDSRHEIHEVDDISRKKVQVPTTSENVIALDSLSCNNGYKEYREAMNNDPDRSADGEQGTSLKLQFPMSAVNVSNGFDVNSGNEKSEILQTVVLVKFSETDGSEQAGTGCNPQSPVVAEVDESVANEVPVSCVNQGKTTISMDGELLPPGPNNVNNSGEAVSEVKGSEIDNDEKRSSSKVVIAHDIESLASENCGILTEATGTDSVEEHGCSGDETRQDKHSSVQSSIAPEEGTTGESKERFRERLWCFLFENLNRAVDELYLLCELECDMEQMKEAILVLEEAASDFQELTKRVLGFEHVKKFTSKSMDGSPVTLKCDHRRPHALSWEVRRMTTSPHKAEILSSSLEAFKKIQQERAKKVAADNSNLEFQLSDHSGDSSGTHMSLAAKCDGTAPSGDSTSKTRKQSEGFDCRIDPNCEKRKMELGKSKNRVNFVHGVHDHQNNSSSGLNSSRPFRDTSAAYSVGKSKKEYEDKPRNRREQYPTDSTTERKLKSADHLRKLTPVVEKETEKKMSASWKSMNAWKEKRNWEDILSSPFRVSSRISHSPGMSRKSGERARVLHDKLMSPEKKKKNALDLKKEAEEKHARAMRIRSELEIERVQKLQRTSEKLNRVSEWQAVRTMKLREGMYARHQRSENRHEAFIAQVVKRAGDESSKVSEVRFITSLNEENKKHILRQKLQDSELRRAEKLQILKTKQKEDMAREEAVLERRKLLEAEKLQRLAEIQRKKEEAQVRREEERKASSAAREARAIEQVRRREERAKAQQEEAELLAQKLSERLSESEQRRKFYLEQIRERASMDFRDQSSPLLRRSGNKEGQGRTTPTKNGEDLRENGVAEMGASTLSTGNVTLQHSLKRRIKKIRQRLMALKYEFLEPPGGSEAAGIGYRTAVGTARVKIGRWLQELQRLRQARKEGAASIGLITADIIKFLEGKDAELQAARQAGLLDFIASALPASHTSKPEDCRVTIHFLKLLRVVLSAPANRSYFLAQNLLPPIVPMLSSALENYIKMAASIHAPAGSNLPPTKTSIEHFETISEVLESFLLAVGMIMGHTNSDEKELQMRDGLLELLIAYQVIHRLRDLFALYDRPQVEGSPFPSSILLSIQLLVVLTSKTMTKYTIDWDSLSEATLGIETHGINPDEIAESTEDCGCAHSVLNNGVIIPYGDVFDDRTLDESYATKSRDELLDSEKPRHMEIQSDLTNPEGPVVGGKLLIQNEQNNLVHNAEKQDSNRSGLKQSASFLFSAMSETGLVCLPSLLTAVLLQANNRLSSELGTYILPANFEEVATGVLMVLNNLALMDMTFIQRMLARPDLKMELFHLMSFLLSHCTSKWKVAVDQVGLLLLESLSLLGYFSLFHRENQAVLRWGKSPTILHKVCDLPFVFFSDSALMPVLASTLVAACYGCEQNKGIVLQELSMDMLHSLLKSCKNVLPSPVQDDPLETNQLGSELKRSLGDTSLRSIRYNSRSTRVSLGKGSALGNAIRGGKIRSQRDLKATKASEEMAQKQKSPALWRPVRLHCWFPSEFIDRVEQFFSPKVTQVGSQV